jgi:long-chain acyl-CoA synthetase
MLLIEKLLEHVKQRGDYPALQVFQHKRWTWFTWQELWQQVSKLANGLQNLGVCDGNRVGIYAENCWQWIIADLACHYLRAVSVPLSTQLSSQQLQSQMRHSGMSLLIVDHRERLDAVSLAIDVLTMFDQPPMTDDNIHCTVLGSCDEIISLVKADAKLEWPTDSDSERIATIIYTSGTTGAPKGVMLSAGNLAFDAEQTLHRYGFDQADHQYCFLPLFHAFARTCDLYTWIFGGHRLTLASDKKNMIADLIHIEPTHINGVPLYFRRLREAVDLVDPANSSVWGARLKQVNSGGAALDDATFRFFQERDITMLEGYGLTETSPVATLNSHNTQRMGSVGKPLNETDVRISEIGEIQIRGPHVFAGYFRDVTLTSATFKDGWLKTGDLGHIDDDGFLFVTGRLDEMIVTTIGENIWPELLELELQEHAVIEQAMVYGHGYDYLVALVHPNWEQFVNRLDVSGDPTVWVDSPNVEQWFFKVVEQQLREFAPYEQIRKVALVQSPWTSENDMLTPKGTLRRSQIAAKFDSILQAMYERTD